MLSIIIPEYNSKDYIQSCVDSAINQSLLQKEIVLIDDGSTDAGGKICDEYAWVNPNVVVAHGLNKGAGAARNIGMKLASGEYIHFVDSDDYLYNNDVYKVREASLSEEIDIYFSRFIGVNPSTLEKEEEQQNYVRTGVYTGDVLKEVLDQEYNMALTCPVNKIFRREYLVNNDLYFTEDIDHEEDEWLPRVLAKAKKVYFDNDFLYVVRAHRPGSVSDSYRDVNRLKQYTSNIDIAVRGMKFMLDEITDKDTLSKVAGYYWEYMINGVLGLSKMTDKGKKKQLLKHVKDNTDFFKNYKLLENKNWQIMGWMFLNCGVWFTSKIVGLRYR